jgi:hypothetical protein
LEIVEAWDATVQSELPLEGNFCPQLPLVLLGVVHVMDTIL